MTAADSLRTPEPAPPPKPSFAGLYLDRRILAVLVLGFISGLPLALAGSTLAFRMAEAGIKTSSIGLFALVLTPFAFKWTWAPLLDRVRLPLLTRMFGRRRGWLLVIQLLLALSIVLLGGFDPVTHTWTVAALAMAMIFFAASHDIVIDAWRIEILESARQGAGSSIAVLGYRMGMLASGAGCLYLAEAFGWEAAYAMMAACTGIGVLTVLCMREPEPPAPRARGGGFAVWLRTTILDPFLDFAKKPHWLAILALILLFRLPDALLGVLSSPFYVQMGFTKPEIAGASKLFGVGATILGGLLGGWLVGRFGALRMMFFGGLSAAAANLLFAWLATRGHDVGALWVAIGIDNLTGGIAAVASVSFLALLTSREYTATQFALLSSLSVAGRDFLVAPAGYLVEAIGWYGFFFVTAAAALPGTLLILWLSRRLPRPAD